MTLFRTDEMTVTKAGNTVVVAVDIAGVATRAEADLTGQQALELSQALMGAFHPLSVLFPEGQTDGG